LTGGNGNGPGGGVIRLDPNYVGLSAFDPLTEVDISGPGKVAEGTSANYSGMATYLHGSIYNFTQTVWIASHFSITNGIFSAGTVTTNTPVILSVQYTNQTRLITQSTNITVSPLPPPVFPSHSIEITNGSFGLRLTGGPGLSYVLEETTNLTSAVWIPLTTNTAGTNGVVNFLDPVKTGVTRRFYRARKLP
jgi:hypothetical protein